MSICSQLVVERGLLGRLFGLPPIVYKCRDARTGVWRRAHAGPLLYLGDAPGRAIPCLHCDRRVIRWPSEYGPTWGLDDDLNANG